MATTEYTARPGDTFCSIGVKHGFPNCDKLRALKENKDAFEEGKAEGEKWALKTGDRVHIPKTFWGNKRKATGKQWDFRRPGEPPVSIRFVHGQNGDDTCAMHPTLKHLHVSNYKTDQGGEKRDKDFPDKDKHEYHEDAHADEDAFKIEVHDAQTKEDILIGVSLEALKPTYADDKEPGKRGDPTDWEEYDDTKKGEGRKLDGCSVWRMPIDEKRPGFWEKKKAKSTKTARSRLERLLRLPQDTGLTDDELTEYTTLSEAHAKLARTRFRTCYLRLVVDEHDWNARTDQTLRIEPLTDTNENKKMEILDHKVRAVYEVEECDGDPKCRAMCDVPVGSKTGNNKKRRVKLAVHILKDSTGGGSITVDQAKNHFMRYYRQFLAQIDLSFEFVAEPHVVDVPANMLEIADVQGNGTALGKAAEGGKEIKVKLTVDGNQEEVKVNTVANENPIKTARRLAAAIVKKFKDEHQTDIDATASENPPLKDEAIGSADVLIGKLGNDPAPPAITIDEVSSADANHGIRCEAIDLTKEVPDFKGVEAVSGNIYERMIVKNYDTGADRVDCCIVHELGAWGEQFRPRGYEDDNKKQPSAEMVNALIADCGVIKNSSELRVFAHETGHILSDCGNHADGDNSEQEKWELMSSPQHGRDQALNHGKRISNPHPDDPTANPKTYANNGVQYDDDANTMYNPAKEMRKNTAPAGRKILGNW
ncbi:MAG: hypothetical protein JSU63_12440 [Phycisphaerales bacterium]|nr:MAG: hypothetical protein JSU63_12440 [Phycisphaerales bacterium]